MAANSGLNGKLFLYDKEKRLPAFLTGSAQRHVIMIGGMEDGFFSTPYVTPLARSLPSLGWALVQCLLSSSYAGYGTCSLAQDADELDALIVSFCTN